MEANTLQPDEKRILGFSRYAITKTGIIRNILLDKVMTIENENGFASNQRFKLTNDEGKRVWIKITDELISELFTEKVETPVEDPYIKEFNKKVEKYKKKPFQSALIGINGSIELHTSDSMVFDNKGNFISEGEKPKGAKKITIAVVLDVRADYAAGMKVKEIGEKYGISAEHARRTGKGQYPKVMPLE